MKPIIFVLGLSAIGKTITAKTLQSEYSFFHIDIDRGKGFARAGFPHEWDKDLNLVDFSLLTARVRDRLNDQHQGAVLSFPTIYRFNRKQLNASSSHGVGVILLWGPLERCWKVRNERQKMNKGTRPSRTDYFRKNRPTFEMYENAEYHEFKADNFESDGTRPPLKTLMARVLERLANQGIELAES